MGDNPTEQATSAPRTVRIWWHTFGQWLARWPGMRLFVQIIRYLFFQLAPGLPTPLRFGMASGARRRIFAYAYFVTVVFCLGVTGTWAYVVGTWSGAEPDRVYLLADWHNLVLYTTVVPVYVSSGILLIITVLGGWHEIASLESSLRGKTVYTSVPLKAPVLCLFALGAAFLAIANYMKDITDPSNVPAVYWFLEITGNGTRTISSLGVYYALLNFVLLLITLTTLIFFMSSVAATLGVARAIATYSRDSPELRFEVVKAKLSTFSEVYLLAKLIIAAYVVNFGIFADSPLGNTTNLFLMQALLVAVGVFFIAIPRNEVELQWFRYKERMEYEELELHSYDDLLDFRAARIANIIDTFFIGSLIAIPGLS